MAPSLRDLLVVAVTVGSLALFGCGGNDKPSSSKKISSGSSTPSGSTSTGGSGTSTGGSGSGGTLPGGGTLGGGSTGGTGGSTGGGTGGSTGGTGGSTGGSTGGTGGSTGGIGGSTGGTGGSTGGTGGSTGGTGGSTGGSTGSTGGTGGSTGGTGGSTGGTGGSTGGTGGSTGGTGGSGGQTGTPTGGVQPSNGIWVAEGFDAAPYGNFGVVGQASQAGNGWGVGTAGSETVAAVGWGGGYAPNMSDVLLTPPLDFTGAQHPVLVFRHAYDIEPNFDGAKVVVWDGVQWNYPDIQGGYPVQQLFYQTPAPGWFTGTQSSFAQVTVDLSAFAGLADVVVGFWFVSDADDTSMPQGWGGFWAINDVLIGEASAIGATVGGGTGSTGGSGGGSTGGSSGQGQLVFAEDLEGASYALGRVSAVGTVEWYVDDPAQFSTPNLPSAAAQGSFCAGTKFATVYDDDAHDLLYTSEIDLSGRTSAQLSFKAYFSLETYGQGQYAADGVRLLATPDQGNTWYLLVPDQGYNYQAIDAFTTSSGSSTPGFGGRSNGWQTYTVDLTPALAIAPRWIVAWEFASDYSIGDAGFFLDDIRVTAQ
ncbi:MAG: hypothetical protein KatS3mg102_0398 [Planctomycetota bacterium]|nr:MAG: hypothetical protein KatS3mg102_0398 [Planctomycetota bacterium]